MKLSVLLILLAAASTCVAQSTAQPFAIPSLPQLSPDSGSAMPAQQSVPILPQISEEDLGHKMRQMLNQVDGSCPVVLTSASLSPYLLLLRSGGNDGRQGGLDLEFRNTSGKSIYSMDFSVEILAKKSKYDLAATRISLDLTVYGARSADETFAQLRHLSLPQAMHPSTVESVTVRQVFYEDGTVWTAREGSFCGLGPNRMMAIAR